MLERPSSPHTPSHTHVIYLQNRHAVSIPLLGPVACDCAVQQTHQG